MKKTITDAALCVVLGAVIYASIHKTEAKEVKIDVEAQQEATRAACWMLSQHELDGLVLAKRESVLKRLQLRCFGEVL